MSVGDGANDPEKELISFMRGGVEWIRCRLCRPPMHIHQDSCSWEYLYGIDQEMMFIHV